MVPPIMVGLYGSANDFQPDLERFRSGVLTLSELPSVEAVSSFIGQNNRKQGRILLITAQDLSNLLGLDVINGSENDPYFKVIVLAIEGYTLERTSIVDSAVFVPQGAPFDVVLDTVRRTADESFSKMENAWCKSVITEIRDIYEELYVTESQISNRPKKLLQRVQTLLGATFLSVYFRNAEQHLYALELNVGYSTPRELPEKAFAALQFSPKCDTQSFPNRANWPTFVSYFSPPPSVNAVVVTTFTIEDLTGVIAYGFSASEACATLWEACHFASREIFHSIRGTRIRSQHEILRAIRPVPDASLDRDEATWEVLRLIKRYFGVEGVSLLELRHKEGQKYTFRKTYVHHERQESETFTADHGCAVEAISTNHALLITSVTPTSNPPTAYGSAYDANVLESGKGKTIEIPYFRTPMTVEDECSLMYYPLIVRDEIAAAIKVGDFHRPRAFDLRHLIELRTLSAPVESLLIHQRLADELRTRASNVAFHERIGQQAETLFFYREIALGVFHQLANHIRTMRSTLALMEIQLAREGPQREEFETNLKDAANSCEAALDLISDAHKRGLTLKPIPKSSSLIRDVIRPAIEYAKERVRGSDVIVNYTLTSREYEVVLDTKLAKEGIINLLTNALWAVREHKHGGKKEIFIVVREEPTGFVRVEISDSGIGMDRSTFEQVAKFRPFVTFRKGGTGLGLYFTQRLMEDFGGKISISRSQPLKGTTVAVTLPLSSGSKG